MTVDSKHHRYFVAKRGEILRNIGEEFGGVVVSFPRPGVTSDKVIILNNAMNTQYLDLLNISVLTENHRFVIILIALVGDTERCQKLC